MTPAEMQRRFQQAQQSLAAGQPAAALATFEPVAAAAALDPGVRMFTSRLREATGDMRGAIADVSAALRAVPPRGRAAAEIGVELGRILARAQQSQAAEAALRTAVLADATFTPARLALARLFMAQNRGAEALETLGAAGDDDVASAQLRTQVLNALGRKTEALAAAERVIALNPKSAVSWHNLAALQGDLRRYADAERSTSRALDLGLSAPELWLVRGRALAGLDRLDEAQAAFEAALARRSDDLEAHRELARLIWMRTGDLSRSTARLEATIAAQPGAAAHIVEHARILADAGQGEAGAALLARAAARAGAPPQLKAMAAQAALPTDPERALRLAKEAFDGEPHNPDMMRTLIEAHLAMGDGPAASALAVRLADSRPADQSALALQAAARRVTGKGPPLPWEDYAALVRGRLIDVPAGWQTLEAYLEALAAALQRLHVTRAHPIGQSVRGGTQTNQNLMETDEPAIQAFMAAIDGPIRAYLDELGAGPDPVRKRNSGGYVLTGMWSVRLAGDGFHTNHVHPEGWISSACHIQVPASVDGAEKQGWLTFGQPGTPTRPPLAPELMVKPQPGRLVLFPSCMWHGTTPFAGPDVRLTIAFDLAPA